MSIGSDFKDYLKSRATVTNHIGTGASARIFDRLGKQGGVLPRILFNVDSGAAEYTLQGLAGAAQTIVQTWCYGIDSDNADEVDAAVRSALVGTTGLNGRGAMGSTKVMDIQDAGPFWGEDKSKDDADDYDPFVRRVYTIMHQEATT